MAGERRYIPASEFCTSVRDGTHDSPKAVAHGRKLVTSRHLTTGRLDLADAYLISDEDFKAINKRSKVDQWDVLISMIGTVGEPCLIKDEPDFAIKNIGLFKTKSEANGKWLYYFLRSKDAQQSIREQSRGTTQQYIPLSALRDFQILVTDDPREQESISAILATLDDKIELNRRMNATLESMARALFQSWFVDFDPVRAKIDGRPPASLDTATIALFPDHFDHDAERVVPVGWNRKHWGDIVTLEYGKSVREYRESDGKYRVFGTNGPIGFHDEALCNSAGIVIGRKGAYRGVHYSPDPFFVIDTAFYLKPKAALDLKWAYYELLRFDINRMDSGSAIPSTSRDDFYGIPVIVPPPEIQAAFGKIVGRWFAKIFANDHESRTLATLRDTLLPKLLSGELSVEVTTT